MKERYHNSYMAEFDEALRSNGFVDSEGGFEFSGVEVEVPVTVIAVAGILLALFCGLGLKSVLYALKSDKDRVKAKEEPEVLPHELPVHKLGSMESIKDEAPLAQIQSGWVAPVKYTRVSGYFGNRSHHPVTGKKDVPHKGMDFAAPVGTPVMAPASGEVVRIALNNGAAGNMLVLKHNKIYKTVYMHLDSYAPGIEVGSRVVPGQVIAFVGNTGRSTGPHLHYEVHKNGVPVDPMSVSMVELAMGDTSQNMASYSSERAIVDSPHNRRH